MERHESLRTRFIAIDGIPLQQVDIAPKYHLKTVDLSALKRTEADHEVRRMTDAFLNSKIDLSVGPVFEARLWRLSPIEHVLFLLVDHIVADGVSNGILAREIWTLYDQGMRGFPSSLPTLPAQFPDYSVWLQQTAASWSKKHEKYWRQRLAGVPGTKIPPDTVSTEAQNSIGVTLHIPFGGELSAKLRGLARHEGTLPSLVALAAYAIVMSRWCQQDDLLIAFVSHGRHRRPALGDMIGYIAEILYLRIEINDNENLRDLLGRLHQELSSAFEHRDFNRVPDLIPECVTDAIFNWQPTSSPRGRLDHHVMLECAAELDWRPPWSRESGADHCPAEHGLRVEAFSARSPGAGVGKFSPVLYDTASGIHMTVSYRPDLLSARTIEWFSQALLSGIQTFADQPLAPLASIRNVPMS